MALRKQVSAPLIIKGPLELEGAILGDDVFETRTAFFE